MICIFVILTEKHIFLAHLFYILTETFEQANEISKRYEKHTGTDSEMEQNRQNKFHHDHPTYRFYDKGLDLNKMFDSAGDA